MAEQSTRLAGTLIGSTLESMGYHYQQAILEAFQAPFENELGGIIYLLAIVLAIVYSATQGGFKLSGWLLIGPPLFFAIIQVQQPIANARWEFGTQQRDNTEGEQAATEATDGAAAGEAMVSTAFAKYVYMVSETVRSVVNTISSGRENTDLWFMVKAQLYAALHTSETRDVGLTHLIHHGLLIECAEAVYWAKAIEDPIFRDFDPNDPQVAAVAGRLQEARDFFAPTRDYAEGRFNAIYRDRKFNISREASRYLAAQTLGQGFTLQQLENETDRISRLPFSCEDVWRLVVSGILKDAGNRYDTLIREGQNHGIPPDTLNNLFLQANGIQRGDPLVFAGTQTQTNGQGQVTTAPNVTANEVNRIRRIIALYHLRNEVNRPDMGSWIAYMTGRHEARLIRTRLDGESSVSERSRVSILEWSEKERLIHSAASLPYYQGLALYLLGTTFPFFALLLLIPGKHSGFLMWFVLWFWVKSWDIGFAIVMLLDDLLFALFAVEQQDFGHVRELGRAANAAGDTAGGTNADIRLTMASLQELDPTFQLSTYYSLVSVALMAIPVASAQIFLGAMAQGVGLIEKGARAFADSFADSAHHHMVRDANTSMRLDVSALLQRRAQADLGNRMAMANLERARMTAANMGITAQELNSYGAGNPGAGIAGADAGANGPGGVGQGAGSPHVEESARPSTVPQQQVTGSKFAQALSTNRAVGRLTGISRSYRPFGGKAGFAEQGLNYVALAGGVKTEDARAQAVLNVKLAEIDYEAARLRWTAIHEEIRELHMRAAPLGILPLPPSGSFYGNEPSEAEFGISLEQFKGDQNQRKAVVDSYTEIAKSATGTISEWLKNRNKAAETPAQINTSLQSLNATERSELTTHLRSMAWALPAFSSIAGHDFKSKEEVQTYLTETEADFEKKFTALTTRLSEIPHEAPAAIGQWAYERPVSPEENFMVERNRFYKYDLPSEEETPRQRRNRLANGPGSLYATPQRREELPQGQPSDGEE